MTEFSHMPEAQKGGRYGGHHPICEIGCQAAKTAALLAKWQNRPCDKAVKTS